VSDDDVTAIYRGLLAGLDWPYPGVGDTGENRATRDRLATWLDELPPGVLPDIPSDYTETPGD
jgi:hypothetical protein